MSTAAPRIRTRVANEAPIRPERDFVLYWMIANRRTHWNFALDHAVAHAERLGRPLLVLEALRLDYPWASPRSHRFVVEGMVDNSSRFRGAGIAYHPYVETELQAGRGLLDALAARACVVVTDEFPCFFLPRMVDAAARRLDVRLETVDSNGVLPLRATEHEFPTAFAFRRFLQRNLGDHLLAGPDPDPLTAPRAARGGEVPREVQDRWPAAPVSVRSRAAAFIDELPLPPGPEPVSTIGGPAAAHRTLQRFLDERLPHYGTSRNHPDEDAGSGLSPYLHFGHLSSHEVVATVLERDGWTPSHLDAAANGKRSGWWGVTPEVESFLDELITWRELGYVFSFHRPDDYDRFDSLPSWARTTLESHTSDPRAVLYDAHQLETAATHDRVWNAAQCQLAREGKIHNYLRMLWGKKILEWSPTPQIALETMIELNNRWALDGRNPNSYSGILWVLGRFDRPWGPEREIFGTVRYMSSVNTLRKLRLKEYLVRYAENPEPLKRF